MQLSHHEKSDKRDWRRSNERESAKGRQERAEMDAEKENLPIRMTDYYRECAKYTNDRAYEKKGVFSPHDKKLEEYINYTVEVGGEEVNPYVLLYSPDGKEVTVFLHWSIVEAGDAMATDR